MLYQAYEYEERDLFKRSLEIALLSFRASKTIHNLEDTWMAGELRSAALALCERVADGLRRGKDSPEAARLRFSEALLQVARIESLWLLAASLGHLDQEALHLFRERLGGPLTLLSQALGGETEAGPSEA